MTKLTELKDITDNLKFISTMNSSDQHSWYVRIKNSLPQLRELFSTVELESAINEYEKNHGKL